MRRADLTTIRLADGVAISVISTGDSILVPAPQFRGGDAGIERFMFDDGTIMSAREFFLPSPGDDNLAGTAGDDTIDALAGNDNVDGFDGNDTLADLARSLAWRFSSP